MIDGRLRSRLPDSKLSVAFWVAFVGFQTSWVAIELQLYLAGIPFSAGSARVEWYLAHGWRLPAYALLPCTFTIIGTSSALLLTGRNAWGKRLDDRARLTMPDVILVAVSLIFAAPLLKVFLDSLNSNAGELSTGMAYLWQLLPPTLLIVALWVIWATSTVGVGR